MNTFVNIYMFQSMSRIKCWDFIEKELSTKILETNNSDWCNPTPHPHPTPSHTTHSVPMGGCCVFGRIVSLGYPVNGLKWWWMVIWCLRIISYFTRTKGDTCNPIVWSATIPNAALRPLGASGSCDREFEIQNRPEYDYLSFQYHTCTWTLSPTTTLIPTPTPIPSNGTVG